MNYLIDGYNLIGYLHHIDLACPNKQDTLKEFLARKQGGKDHYDIIFDGKSPENTIGIHERYGSIVIYYTPQGTSADHHIMDTCKLLKNKKSITVVSSDQEIVKEAQRLRVPVLTSQAFIRLILANKGSSQKPEPTDQDTDYWLSEMGGGS